VIREVKGKLLHLRNFSHQEEIGYVSRLALPQCYLNEISNAILIVDTGASVCITPQRSDFITYQPSNMKIKDPSSTNKVKGEGILR
jgi:hypothetical protein